jgi:hypothetical protein
MRVEQIALYDAGTTAIGARRGNSVEIWPHCWKKIEVNCEEIRG